MPMFRALAALSVSLFKGGFRGRGRAGGRPGFSGAPGSLTPGYGREGGIRTHEPRERSLNFESSPFNHSGTSPGLFVLPDGLQSTRQVAGIEAILHEEKGC